MAENKIIRAARLATELLDGLETKDVLLGDLSRRAARLAALLGKAEMKDALLKQSVEIDDIERAVVDVKQTLEGLRPAEYEAVPSLGTLLNPYARHKAWEGHLEAELAGKRSELYRVILALAGEAERGESDSEPPQIPALTIVQKELLQAIYETGVTDVEALRRASPRPTAKYLAEKALAADGSAYVRQALAGLKQLGLIGNGNDHHLRNHGYFLTPEGVRISRALFSK